VEIVECWELSGREKMKKRKYSFNKEVIEEVLNFSEAVLLDFLSGRRLFCFFV